MTLLIRSTRLQRQSREQTLSELLAEPIVQDVMRSDRVAHDDIVTLFAAPPRAPEDGP